MMYHLCVGEFSCTDIWRRYRLVQVYCIVLVLYLVIHAYAVTQESLDGDGEGARTAGGCGFIDRHCSIPL